MNCWNTLRADENHNVAGNSKRDGLRISRIGQSAAKGLSGLEPTDVTTQAFDLDNMILCHVVPSTGHDLVALDGGFGLLSFAEQVREDVEKQVISERVVVENLVCGFAGRKNSFVDAPIRFAGEKFYWGSLAHGYFYDDSELESVRCSVLGGMFAYPYATLPINESGDVRSNSLVHSASWSTFNDYPEREYGEAPGSMRLSQHTSDAADDIVFSARKRAAACKRRCQTRALARKLKAYSGDDYIALGWPSTFRAVKNTLETLHQYTESGIKLIFNGEIGRYENLRFVEQTNVTKGITATGASGVAWTGADSDWVFFFGEDTVAEGIAIPEEVRAKIPTDYGRSKGVAWYALLGYGIVHTNATQARIVMWDSAA